MSSSLLWRLGGGVPSSSLWWRAPLCRLGEDASSSSLSWRVLLWRRGGEVSSSLLWRPGGKAPSFLAVSCSPLRLRGGDRSCPPGPLLREGERSSPAGPLALRGGEDSSSAAARGCPLAPGPFLSGCASPLPLASSSSGESWRKRLWPPAPLPLDPPSSLSGVSCRAALSGGPAWGRGAAEAWSRDTHPLPSSPRER